MSAWILQFVVLSLTQQLGYERVGVIVVKIGIAGLQRVNLIIIVEETGEPEVVVVAGDGIELVHSIVETAKLIAQHSPSCAVVEWAQLIIGPVAHPHSHMESSVVAAEPVLIDKSLNNLVECISRCPDALALDIAVDEPLTECTEITATTVGLLHLVETVDEAISLGFDHRRARLSIEHGQG